MNIIGKSVFDGIDEIMSLIQQQNVENIARLMGYLDGGYHML